MKKLIFLLIFLTPIFAQLTHTTAEVDTAVTRALVNYNRVVYFTPEGTATNTGLNVNDAFETLTQALAKATALVPTNTNRILCYGFGYDVKDASNYSIPNYVSVQHLSGTYSGTITLGDSSKFISYNEVTAGGVTSVFSRTGAVIAVANDYTIAQIQYATDSLNTRVKYSDSLTTFVTPTQLADSAFLVASDITGKVDYSDSLTTFTTPTQIADSAFLQAADIASKVNYSDSLTTFTTPTQIADSAFLQASDITGKVNYSDSLTVFTTPSQIADSLFLQAVDITGKVNYSDSLTVFTTPSQIADSLFLQAADIAGKVNYSDSLTTFLTPTQLTDSLNAYSITRLAAGNWKVFYSNGSGVPVEVALGVANTVLTSNGAAAAPTFETPSSGFSDPMTTRGDIIYRDATNTTNRLALGTVGQVPVSDGTDLAYGDIVNSIDTLGGSGITGNMFIKAGSNVTVTRVVDTLTIASTASGGGSSLMDTVIYKTADESVTSSTTLQDDDHLFVALAANTVYQFEFSLSGDGATAGDLKIVPTIPSGAVSRTVSIGMGLGGTNPQSADNVQVDGVTLASGYFFGTASTAGGFTIKGIIETSSTAGNLTLTWAQTASNATATRLFKYSYLKIRELP